MPNPPEIEQLHRLLLQRDRLAAPPSAGQQPLPPHERRALEARLDREIRDARAALEEQAARFRNQANRVRQQQRELAQRVSAGGVPAKRANKESRQLHELLTLCEARQAICEQAARADSPDRLEALLPAAATLRAPAAGPAGASGGAEARNHQRLIVCVTALLTALAVFLPWYDHGPGTAGANLFDYYLWLDGDGSANAIYFILWMLYFGAPLVATAAAMATRDGRAAGGIAIAGGACVFFVALHAALAWGSPGVDFSLGRVFRWGPLTYFLGGVLLMMFAVHRQRLTDPAKAPRPRVQWGFAGSHTVLVVGGFLWLLLFAPPGAVAFDLTYSPQERVAAVYCHNTGPAPARLFTPWPDGQPLPGAARREYGLVLYVQEQGDGTLRAFPDSGAAWSAPGLVRLEDGSVEIPPRTTVYVLLDVDALRELGVVPHRFAVEVTDGAGRGRAWFSHFSER